jgi:dTDP-glucose pyrophosphorylase
MKPTLLVLAAGMGSRYGGLKQVDPVGPNGETIIDYSIYDAIKAGFGKVVFVIRQSFHDAFKERFDAKYGDKIEIAYAHQELGACIGNFQIPADREKPWGTGHAILVAKDQVDGPFAVINADDFYGRGAFELMAAELTKADTSENDYSMVGYKLCNTLSEHGSVSRGVCKSDENSSLVTVTEHSKIEKIDDTINALDGDDEKCTLSDNTIVSMNLWGFQKSIFTALQSKFDTFLIEKGGELKSELYIPFVVDEMINSGQATVKVIETDEKWFGVTYKDDKAMTQASIKALVDNGTYPQAL